MVPFSHLKMVCMMDKEIACYIPYCGEVQNQKEMRQGDAYVANLTLEQGQPNLKKKGRTSYTQPLPRKTLKRETCQKGRVLNAKELLSRKPEGKKDVNEGAHGIS